MRFFLLLILKSSPHPSYPYLILNVNFSLSPHVKEEEYYGDGRIKEREKALRKDRFNFMLAHKGNMDIKGLVLTCLSNWLFAQCPQFPQCASSFLSFLSFSLVHPAVVSSVFPFLAKLAA